MKIFNWIRRKLGYVISICQVCSKDIWGKKGVITVRKRTLRVPKQERITMTTQKEMCDKCWEGLNKMF